MKSIVKYRDISNLSDSDAGYQFEFYCETCSDTIESKFSPAHLRRWAHRLSVLSSVFGVNTSDLGTRVENASLAFDGKSHDKAMEKAIRAVESKYRQCPSCKRTCCTKCCPTDSSPCPVCAQESHSQGASYNSPGDSGSSLKCPSCQAPQDGSRFCRNCGYDLAGALKTCPACGETCDRQSRFCGSCGHSF